MSCFLLVPSPNGLMLPTDAGNKAFIYSDQVLRRWHFRAMWGGSGKPGRVLLSVDPMKSWEDFNQDPVTQKQLMLSWLEGLGMLHIQILAGF